MTSAGGSYTGDLYLNVGHSNYIYVYGYTTGQSYSVTVAPNTAHVSDGDASDLTTDDYIYPSYSGYQTGYGHTDFYADGDTGYLYVNNSGYYDVTSTGNTYTFVFDQSVGAWMISAGGSYTNAIYLTAGHANYISVYGYTNGENYSVTVAPHT